MYCRENIILEDSFTSFVYVSPRFKKYIKMEKTKQKCNLAHNKSFNWNDKQARELPQNIFDAHYGYSYSTWW